MNTRNIIALLACCLGFAAFDARSEGLKPVAFGLHTFSAHFPSKDHHRNDNYGFYVRGEHYQAGLYMNSINRPAPYAAYVHKLGQVDLLLGVAGGYQERCHVNTIKTGEKLTITHTKTGVEKTTVPTYSSTEYCSGFARGYFTPMAGLSIASPVAVLGATPVLFVAPGFGKAASVAHISIQWSI